MLRRECGRGGAGAADAGGAGRRGRKQQLVAAGEGGDPAASGAGT